MSDHPVPAHDGRIARDVALMQSQTSWPRYPILPLRKRSGDLMDDDYCGLLLADRRPVVYVGNLLLRGQRTWLEYLKTLEARTFSSFEALAAVWEVD